MAAGGAGAGGAGAGADTGAGTEGVGLLTIRLSRSGLTYGWARGGGTAGRTPAPIVVPPPSPGLPIPMPGAAGRNGIGRGGPRPMEGGSVR